MSTLIRLPGQTSSPGYYETVTSTVTVTETVRVCQQEPIITIVTVIVGGGDVGTGETITVPGPYDQDFVDAQPIGTVVIFIHDTGQTQEVCREEEITREITKTEQVWHGGSSKPAFEKGWTAGADSVAKMTGDGGFQFSIKPGSVGVYCGLSHSSASVHPAEIKYAFYCSGTSYHTQPNLVSGSFTGATVFMVQRIGSVISWVVDQIVVDSLVVKNLPETLVADASLYATDDAVVDAEFVDASQLQITGEAAGELPALIGESQSVFDLRGEGAGALPALIGRSYSGGGENSGYGDGLLPMLIGSSLQASLSGGGNGQLPNLTSTGGISENHGQGAGELPKLIGLAHSGTGGIGNGSLPSLTGYAYAFPEPQVNIGWGILPTLAGWAHGVISFDLIGTGDGTLPVLRSFASDHFTGYGRGELPTLTGRAWVKKNDGVLALSSPIGSGHGGISQWDGYCFIDPIRQQLKDGLKGTWLVEPEKRIETYFGLLGSNTRNLTVVSTYDEVSGVLAYVATTYQSGTPLKFDLHIDLLDFVPPNLTSAGWSVDRILAHELVHAVMNDRINTTTWPGWFSEGLCEFIHGAKERVSQDIAREGGIANLLSVLNESVSGHDGMSSKHYSAGYLAVWKLHSVTTNGIKTLLQAMVNGSTLSAALNAHTPFTSVTNFLSWMTGANGVAFVQDIINRQLLESADTGAIGGYAVDNGPILDNYDVISDTLT